MAVVAVAAGTTGPAAAAETVPLVARDATQDSGAFAQGNLAGPAAGTGAALPAADTAPPSAGTVLTATLAMATAAVARAAATAV